MKNDDPQQLKPVYIHETSYCADNEISLIDLALALVRRKKMISLILIVFITTGLTTALLTPKTYLYTSVLEIGSQVISGKLRTLEPTTALIAKLDSSYIPQILYKYQLSNPADKGKYKIKTSSPSSSSSIILEMQGPEEQGDLVKSFLQQTGQEVVFAHTNIYTSIKSNLEALLDQAKHELQKLKQSSNNETEITTQYKKIEVYSSRLASLRNTQIISPPMRSLEPTGPNKKLIVILSTFAGLFFAVFAAFFAEFVSKVREKALLENKDL